MNLINDLRKNRGKTSLKNLATAIVVVICLSFCLQGWTFEHPGIPLTVADLDGVKANLNRWPWSDGYSALKNDWLSNTNFIMHGPYGYVNRNASGNYDNQGAWQTDMQAIFNQARMWYFTGDNNYAQHAHDMLLAWANTMTNFGGQESGLDLGDYAYRYGGGADILRGTWPGWTTADTLTVSNFFRKVYLPSTGVGSASMGVLGPSNKGALQMAGALACAVFCDDTNLFNQILYLYRTSASCGLHYNCLSSGEMGETGRDQGHAYNDLLQMAFCAEVFYKQGVDVYSEDDNRLLACGEYWSRNNMNPAADYITFGTSDEIYWNNSTGTAGNSAGGNFAADPMAGNILRSAYVLRKGMSAPWMVAKRNAWAGGLVVNAQNENENSFCYLKSEDISTAAPPASIAYPAASSVTTGLINTEIGSVGVAGNGSYSGGAWTVNGGGAEVWTHSADSCHFVYKPMNGNCTIIAKVNAVPTTTAATAKAGVMIRDSLSSSASRRAWVAITASSTIEAYNHGWSQCYGGSNWETFPRKGAGTKWVPSMPYWVKVERLGNTLSTYISLDGTSWEVTTVAVYESMPSTSYIGLFVCALNTSTASTATFSNVSITGGDGGNVTIPPAPYAIYASPDTGRVPLRWLQSFGATSYNVLRSTTDGGPYTVIATGVTNASYTDTNVAPGTLYYYTITASNSAGTSDNSPRDEATTTPVPSAPTGLTTWTGDQLVKIGWTASGAATSYYIYRSTESGGTYELAGNTTLTSYLDTGLADGMTYYYVVRAANGAGESANSSEISAKPSTQTVISINFQGGSTQNGTPSAMAPNEMAGWVVVSNWNNAAGSGTSGSLGMLIQNDGAGTSASANWSGNNLWSTPVSENAGDYRMMKGYLDTSYSSTSSVNISGLPPTYTENGYDVYVYIDGDNGGTAKTGVYKIGSTTISVTDGASANFSGTLVQGNNSTGNVAIFHNQTSGSFTLTAIGSTADGGGARAPINAIQIVAHVFTGVPSAPTGLNAIPGNGQVTLVWNSMPEAASYYVKRSSISGGDYVTVANVTGTTYVNSGLANGTTYYYVVTATNSFGESGNSFETGIAPNTGSDVSVTWNGSASGTWDVSTPNWIYGGLSAVYQESEIAVFDDSASGNTSVILSANRMPTEVVVSNSLKTYSIGGSSIAGSGGLAKSGTGILTLNGANTFGGGVTLNDGAIIYQNGQAFGSGTLTLAGGTLAKNIGAVTVTNPINVTGTVSYVATGGGDPVFTGPVTGSGTFSMPNITLAGITPQATSLKFEGSIAGYTGTFAQTAGNNRLRFGRTSAGSIVIDGSNARFVTFGSTSSGNPLDVADASYGTFKMGELSGSGGIIRGGWASTGNTTFEIGALNTSTVYAGSIQDNLRDGAGLSGVNKVGAGTLILSGPCSYTGTTLVSSGKLVILTEFSGNGNFTVADGATLGITNTTAAKSALISSLTVVEGATLEFQNVASTTTPLVTANALTVNGACTVAIANSNGLATGNSYPLVSGLFNGSFENLKLRMPYGWRGTLTNTGNQIVLTDINTVSTMPADVSVTQASQQLQITWPTDHIGWRLQTKSNLADVFWSDLWETSLTNFAAIPMTNHSAFFRLVYP